MIISKLINDKKTMNWPAISVVPPLMARLENSIESKMEGMRIGKARMERMPMLLFVLEAIALTIVRVEDRLVLPSITARKNNQ